MQDAVAAFYAGEDTHVLEDDALLSDLGMTAGSPEARETALEANVNGPVHRPVGRFGRRVDAVDFHPAWHWFMERGVSYGLQGAPWASDDENAHLRRAAGFVTWSGGANRATCAPDDNVRSRVGPPPRRRRMERYGEGLMSRRYTPGATPAPEKRGLLAGMGMTRRSRAAGTCAPT